MHHVFSPNLDVFLTVYLDDILVFSQMYEEHLQHVRWVLGQLKKHKLVGKRQKSAFTLTKVEYLGHIISNGQFMVDTSKTSAVADWPAPKTVKELQ